MAFVISQSAMLPTWMIALPLALVISLAVASAVNEVVLFMTTEAPRRMRRRAYSRPRPWLELVIKAT
jgi:hypothetical protein